MQYYGAVIILVVISVFFDDSDAAPLFRKKAFIARKKAAVEQQPASSSNVNSGNKSKQLTEAVRDMVLGKMNEDQLDEIRTILKTNGDSEKRQQLLRKIADSIRGMTSECPPTLPASFCKQPLTFFLWMKEVRNQEKERQMHEYVKQFINDLYATSKDLRI